MGKPTPTFDPETEAAIRAENHAGASFDALAEKYGVGRKTIENAIRRAGGAKSRTGPTAFTNDEAMRLRKRLEAGETIEAMSVELGAARPTIANAIKRVGGKVKLGQPRRVDGYLTLEGYRRVLLDPSDPMYVMGSKHGNTVTRTVLEHRLVLARKLGRSLLAHETVDHINGDRLDNRPENLELRVGRHGKGATAAHCATCTCFEHNTSS